MEISESMADDAILAELGERLARRRLDLQLTQAALAEQAGVAKRTVERIEAGASAQLTSLVRILRVLDLLSGLEQLVSPPGPRPLELLRLKGRQRQRASTQAPAGRDAPWSWDDDT
jgi:transcriptional regulator with XRE-family HTH domain